jgi:hypothetical protein
VLIRSEFSPGLRLDYKTFSLIRLSSRRKFKCFNEANFPTGPGSPASGIRRPQTAVDIDRRLEQQLILDRKIHGDLGRVRERLGGDLAPRSCLDAVMSTTSIE